MEETHSRPVMELAEFQAEMERRGKLDCKFVCPICGHAASPNDWKALLPDLTDPGRAARECIGRVMPADQVIPGLVSTDRKRTDEPCDYAAWGLFDLCKAAVRLPEGNVIGVFEFA